MSTAAKQRTVKFIPAIGTLTAYCTCTQGKLFQRYSSADGGTYTNIFPNFSVMQPVIEFVVTNSRMNAGSTAVEIDAPTIYFGSTELTFDSGGSCTSPLLQPMFKLVKPDDAGSNGHWGLKILQNIVAANAGASIVVSFHASIASGAVAGGDVDASYDISIMQTQSDGATLAIKAVDHDFTFDSSADTVTLEPMLYYGSTPVAYANGTDWSIKWYLLQGGQYQELTGSHVSGGGLQPWQCKISANDIGTIGWVKCEALYQGTSKAVAIAEILDTSDGFYIEPHADPADETIVDGDPVLNKVTYRPKLMSAKNNQAVDPQPKFHFLATSAEGVVLNPYHCDANGVGTDNHQRATAPLEWFEVTAAMCQQAGGDVSVFIQTDGTEYQ